MESLVQLLTVLVAIAITSSFLVAFLALDWIARRSSRVARFLDAPNPRRIIGGDHE